MCAPPTEMRCLTGPVGVAITHRLHHVVLRTTAAFNSPAHNVQSNGSSRFGSCVRRCAVYASILHLFITVACAVTPAGATTTLAEPATVIDESSQGTN